VEVENVSGSCGMMVGRMKVGGGELDLREGMVVNYGRGESANGRCVEVSSSSRVVVRESVGPVVLTCNY